MLLGELGEVLRRPKFRRWITAEQVAAFVELLDREAESWDDPAEIPPVTGDAKDDYLVALIEARKLTCWCQAIPTSPSCRLPT
jgi:uncharacterized protein